MNERKMPEESRKRMLMPFRSVRRSISSGRKKNFWNFWNDLKEDLRSIVCASNPACAGKSLIKPVLCKIAFFFLQKKKKRQKKLSALNRFLQAAAAACRFFVGYNRNPRRSLDEGRKQRERRERTSSEVEEDKTEHKASKHE